MAIQTIEVLALVSLMALCGANPTGNANQDATKTSGAAPSSISMATPEMSLGGATPSSGQMNMMGVGGIEEIVAEAMKNTMAQSGLTPNSVGQSGFPSNPLAQGGFPSNPMTQGGLPLNTMGGMPNIQNNGILPTLPIRMPSMPRLPMNLFGMMNPMSMLGGGGSPMGMMRPMMMMNMMDNLFEMIGF